MSFCVGICSQKQPILPSLIIHSIEIPTLEIRIKSERLIIRHFLTAKSFGFFSVSFDHPYWPLMVILKLRIVFSEKCFQKFAFAQMKLQKGIFFLDFSFLVSLFMIVTMNLETVVKARAIKYHKTLISFFRYDLIRIWVCVGKRNWTCNLRLWNPSQLDIILKGQFRRFRSELI